jgi:5-formyltetrahydrofolate cyclo-ligase
MTKEALRKKYLQKRMDLSEGDYFQLSKDICDMFFIHTDLSKIRMLHTFMPIRKNKEVDTWMIVERVKREFPHMQISIPKINNQSGTLDNFVLEGPNQLQNNTWGIPEPVRGIPIATTDIDAVLVPLLAFDKRGHRVGYGRGFYDKFLISCRKDCVKIGLSFFDMAEKITGLNENDVALDLIITPKSSILINDL